MLCAGDEIGRTQWGNNNAYCHDSELTWLDWNLDRSRRALLEFTGRLIALRRRHPVLRRQQFFHGRKLRGSEVKDLSWFRPDGKEMTDEDWNVYTRCLGLRLAGDAIDDIDAEGQRVGGDTVLVLVNAHHEPLDFVLPGHQRGVRWELLVDTRAAEAPRRAAPFRAGTSYPLESRSLALFQLVSRSRRTPHRPTG